MMVILFLFAAIGFALVSLSFSIYNARKVPYQSIKGHKGLYLWNVIAGRLHPLCNLPLLPLTSFLSFYTFHSQFFLSHLSCFLLQCTTFIHIQWFRVFSSPTVTYRLRLFPALFGALGVLCFLAAVRHHRLTERVANYQENLFVLVVLDDSLDWSFWLGVGSVATHFAVCGVVAMSRIKLPKPEMKKPEEPTISALDLLYWRAEQGACWHLHITEGLGKPHWLKIK